MPAVHCCCRCPQLLPLRASNVTGTVHDMFLIFGLLLLSNSRSNLCFLQICISSYLYYTNARINPEDPTQSHIAVAVTERNLQQLFRNYLCFTSNKMLVKSANSISVQHMYSKSVQTFNRRPQFSAGKAAATLRPERGERMRNGSACQRQVTCSLFSISIFPGPSSAAAQ